MDQNPGRGRHVTRYALATVKPWNLDAFRRRSGGVPGVWDLIERPEDLTPARLAGTRYAFFPHWSWKVPSEVLATTDCVCFHMADVPYGRGGSPLQNLIARGHRTTVMTALRMVEELDAGPVYAKRPLDLAGSAQKIFERAADLIWDMIAGIAADEPAPVPQTGTPVVFPRRTPAQSRLPGDADPVALYDHIRMLDADGYPRAFLDHGRMRIEFADATLSDDSVTATVTIRRMPPPETPA
jgi:methionyl-tRNA formyltransferase